jgi:hypothetical protein
MQKVKRGAENLYPSHIQDREVMGTGRVRSGLVFACVGLGGFTRMLRTHAGVPVLLEALAPRGRLWVGYVAGQSGGIGAGEAPELEFAVGEIGERQEIYA